jgi:hypothetical protein
VIEASLLSGARRALDDVRSIGLDTPFRVLASLLGIAAVVAWHDAAMSRPSDAVIAATSWVGIDITDATLEVARWFADDGRVDVVADVGVVLIALGLFALMSQVQQASYFPVEGLRCASTVIVGFALYAQARGDRIDGELWAVIWLMLLWILVKLRHVVVAVLRFVVALRGSGFAYGRGWSEGASTQGEQRSLHVVSALVELAWSILWVPLALLAWFVTRSVRRSGGTGVAAAP